jgi:hypothetical protein
MVVGRLHNFLREQLFVGYLCVAFHVCCVAKQRRVVQRHAARSAVRPKVSNFFGRVGAICQSHFSFPSLWSSVFSSSPPWTSKSERQHDE